MKKIYNWATSLNFVKKLIKNKIFAKLFSYEFLNYIFYGVLTTAVNVAVFSLFNFLLGNGPLTSVQVFGKAYDISWVYVSNFIAWIIAVLFAFFTNKLFVFESKSWKAAVLIKEFPPFIGARVTSLLIETLGLVLLFEIIGINEMLSKLILAVFVVIINYFFSKFVVFKEKKDINETEINQSKK